MKVSKLKRKKHDEVMDLLKLDRDLNQHEVYQFHEHFQESLLSDIGATGTFFTPMNLCRDFSLETQKDVKTIDLCSGIGALTHHDYFYSDDREAFTCVERNYRFVEIGKKLYPKANWICGDVLEVKGRYKQSISNPPFGKIIARTDWEGDYTGSDFEYRVIEKASQISDYGVFIIPQNSTPFRYSGQQIYQEKIEKKYQKFLDETGIEFDFNCGIDTAGAEWKNTNIITEIVCADFPAEEIPEEISSLPLWEAMA
jgi:hypothetical protein